MSRSENHAVEMIVSYLWRCNIDLARFDAIIYLIHAQGQHVWKPPEPPFVEGLISLTQWLFRLVQPLSLTWPCPSLSCFMMWERHVLGTSVKIIWIKIKIGGILRYWHRCQEQLLENASFEGPSNTDIWRKLMEIGLCRVHVQIIPS